MSGKPLQSLIPPVSTHRAPPASFSVEALATSSHLLHKPLQDVTTHPAGAAGQQTMDYSSLTPGGGRPGVVPPAGLHPLRGPMDPAHPRPINAQAFAMRGYGIFGDPKSGAMPGMTGVPVRPGAMHPGNPQVLHYGTTFPWPKLVTQRY